MRKLLSMLSLGVLSLGLLSSTCYAGRFSPEEDQRLERLVAQYGTNDWGNVSRLMGNNRTMRQCKERWVFYLSDVHRRAPFTPEEDRIIIEKVKELGPKWAKIGAILGRPGIQVKCRREKILHINECFNRSDRWDVQLDLDIEDLQSQLQPQAQPQPQLQPQAQPQPNEENDEADDWRSIFGEEDLKSLFDEVDEVDDGGSIFEEEYLKSLFDEVDEVDDGGSIFENELDEWGDVFWD